MQRVPQQICISQGSLWFINIQPLRVSGSTSGRWNVFFNWWFCNRNLAASRYFVYASFLSFCTVQKSVLAPQDTCFTRPSYISFKSVVETGHSAWESGFKLDLQENHSDTFTQISSWKNKMWNAERNNHFVPISHITRGRRQWERRFLVAMRWCSSCAHDCETALSLQIAFCYIYCTYLHIFHVLTINYLRSHSSDFAFLRFAPRINCTNFNFETAPISSLHRRVSFDHLDCLKIRMNTEWQQRWIRNDNKDLLT